jgi:hypothetical protein
MSYRLLSSHLPKETDRLKEAAFIVSVDRTLNEQEVRTLVCEIVAKENPRGYERLTIGIFVDLDRYIPAAESPILERELSEHRLANYVWARSVPDASRRLSITRDSDGKPLSQWQFYNFDHTKDCKQ